jgi:hypothetical protein
MVDAAILAIRYHAGLADISRATPSLVDVLHNRPTDRDDVATSVREVILALQDLNLALNGSIPSKSTLRDHDMPRAAVAAIASIAAALSHEATKDSVGLATMFTRELWRITCAWDGVLAGDIDDIVEHVRLEELAL